MMIDFKRISRCWCRKFLGHKISPAWKECLDRGTTENIKIPTLPSCKIFQMTANKRVEANWSYVIDPHCTCCVESDYLTPHGGHFTTWRFISIAEWKAASRPVSMEYVRMQIVVEGEVRELDIQRLPTSPVLHFFFRWLAHFSMCSLIINAQRCFLSLPHAKRQTFSFSASSVCCYKTRGLSPALTVRREIQFRCW